MCVVRACPRGVATQWCVGKFFIVGGNIKCYLEPFAAVMGTHALASHARFAASSLDTGCDNPTAAAGAAAATDGTAAGHSATGHSVAAVGATPRHCSGAAAAPVAGHSTGHTAAAAGGAIGAATIGSA